jgi:hypothetical protein
MGKIDNLVKNSTTITIINPMDNLHIMSNAHYNQLILLLDLFTSTQFAANTEPVGIWYMHFS